MSPGYKISETVPDWYRIERETEKTISMLSASRELEFFTRSPDEFIRRLAIVRVAEIRSKQLIHLLKEILEAENEEPENKLLAAWALKKTASADKTDILYNHVLSSRFTGLETYEDMFQVDSGRPVSSPKFCLDSSLAAPALETTPDEFSLSKEINFNAVLDIGMWLNVLSTSAVSRLKLFIKSIKTKLTFRRSGKKIMNAEKRYGPSYDYRDSYRYAGNGGGAASGVAGNMLFNLLYVILYPVRFIRKYKLTAFAALIAIYCFFAYSEAGKSISYKYAGIQLINIQNTLMHAAGKFALDIWNGLEDLTGMDAVSGNYNTDQDNLYTVTAINGLNIRKAPNAGSELAGEAIPFGRVVICLMKSSQDTKGRTWLYVRAPDGRVGWVSSKFLVERKG